MQTIFKCNNQKLYAFIIAEALILSFKYSNRNTANILQIYIWKTLQTETAGINTRGCTRETSESKDLLTLLVRHIFFKWRDFKEQNPITMEDLVFHASVRDLLKCHQQEDLCNLF